MADLATILGVLGSPTAAAAAADQYSQWANPGPLAGAPGAPAPLEGLTAAPDAQPLPGGDPLAETMGYKQRRVTLPPVAPAPSAPPSGAGLAALLAGMPDTNRTTSGTTSGVRVGPGIKRGLAETRGDLQDIADWRAGLAQDTAAAASGIRQKAADQLKLRNEEFAKQSKVLLEQQGIASKALQNAIAKLESGKIHPNRLWKDSSTADKVFMILGAIMGGLAQGLSNGRIPNMAVKLISDAINRDVAAQKADMVRQQGVVAAKKSVVDQIYRQVGDLRQAEMLHRKLLWETVQNKLAKLQTESAGEMGAINAAITSVKARQEELKQLIQLAPRSSYTVTNAPNRMKDALRLQMAKMAMRGTGGKEPKEKWRQAMVDGSAFIDDINSLIERVKQNKYSRVARHLWPFGEANQLKKDLDVLAANARKLKGKEVGIMTDKDYNRYQTDLNAWWRSGGDILSGLERLRDASLRAAYKTIQEAQGYGYNVNPTIRLFIKQKPAQKPAQVIQTQVP